ncbi:hypothetical protein DFH09DRAFT_1100718 [Mycena vulgaris]|nr:hypothetical protein DFH09DRAFT_1100718 [Mycena vulgaris]
MSASSDSEPGGKRAQGEAPAGKESERAVGAEGKLERETEKAAAVPSAPGFFAWVGPALKSRRTLKTWLRCVLTVAAAMVLLVDHATLNTMGQAGFFAAIVSVMLPPSLALSMFVFASVTLLFGMLLGWAWGAACMAAALSVQDKALLAARMAAAQKSLVAGVSPTLQIQSLIFHGAFLDPRSSAVYGALFFIGAFAMGAVRAVAPKLALLSIFGTIVMDVFCSTGPLLPTAQYTIAKQFLIPTLYYLAIAIAALVFVFPESLNHIWLTTLDQAFFGPALSVLSLQATALAARPSDHAAWAGVAGKVAAARAGLGGGLAALAAQIGLIDLEISVGRLGPGDLKRLAPEFRSLGFRTSRFARRRRMIMAREARHGHGLDELVPILAQVSAPLRAAAEASATALRAWFVGCNAGRWTGLVRHANPEAVAARQKGLVEARDGLEAALGAFRAVERVRLIAPFERFFDPETGKLLEGIGKGAEDEEMFAVRSLFMCFVFCDTLDAFAARLHRVLALVVELDKKRPAPRVWMPSGFGMLGRKLMSPAEVTVDMQPLAMGTASDPTKFEGARAADNVDEDNTIKEEEEAPVRPRNPDALPPTSGLGRFSVALGASLHFFKTPEGIFALRHAVVSLALWVPAVVPRTAWFYYDNKGLWALIMAQTGLATFAGDQLFGLATRLLGTLAGLLNGMIVWYIAAPGKADGNAYAVVVVTAVFVAPFILARVAAPPAQIMFWTMVGVTTVFVVGYSWLDTHFALISNSGVGISLGWKRALLVIIGFVAGAIVMMFPRPTSARMLVRRTLAATLQEMGSIFGQEVEAFLAEEARARGGHFEQEKIDWVDQSSGDGVSPKERRVRKVGQRVLVVFERLQGLASSLKTGRWEPQVQTKLVTSLALLAGAFSKLDTKWCSILVHRTPFLNPNLLSDIFSIIDILSHALEAGHPVPASLPCLRERLVYHDAHLGSMRRNAREPAPPNVTDNDNDDSDSETAASELVAGKVDGASIGFEELSLSVLMDEQLPTHSTGTLPLPFSILAVIALANILTLIDEIGAIVRELCGQTTFRGFDALHHEFLGREEAAMGTSAQKVQ